MSNDNQPQTPEEKPAEVEVADENIAASQASEPAPAEEPAPATEPAPAEEPAPATEPAPAEEPAPATEPVAAKQEYNQKDVDEVNAQLNSHLEKLPQGHHHRAIIAEFQDLINRAEVELEKVWDWVKSEMKNI